MNMKYMRNMKRGRKESEEAIMPECIVIGGGAAGMMAAGTAARAGIDTAIVEKNDRLGRKLRITGKGRCNVTNIADMETMMQQIPGNAKFLYSAFRNFTNEDTVAFFEQWGVPLKTERGGRVFPQSDKAVDIVNALIRFCRENGVKSLRAQATEVLAPEGRVRGIRLQNGKTIACRSVILATGGKSYPRTGSTGEGYRIAQQLGHRIVPPRASLVPVETKEAWVHAMQGLSLKNVRLSLYEDNKKIWEEQGELLFTHFGLSGPLVLSASCHMRGFPDKAYELRIDLKPALEEQVLKERLLRDFQIYANKDIINYLPTLVPQKLTGYLLQQSGLEAHAKVHQIRREQRRNIMNALKEMRIPVSGLRPIEEAIITAGGVSTKEVNPSTMESKRVRGLYFAGEVLDVDAYTGGYNLQIAFSTGVLAGLQKGRELSET